MWEKILALFKGAKMDKFSAALSKLTPFLSHLEQNFENDKDAKNALIDSVMQILQQHKDVS